jgi:hypothetical protein
MASSHRSRLSLIASAICLLCQACSVAPPIQQCPPKDEAPAVLLLPPEDQALRNLFAILGLPYETSEPSTNATPPEPAH